MKAFVQHQNKDSDKLVLQALIPFVDLNKSALFTQKVLYNDVVADNNLLDVEGNANYYQRRLDTRRLREIKKYIYNSILDEKENVAVSALFPTAMILAVRCEDMPEAENDIINITFDQQNRLYIVDGQHRLMAMRQLYEDLSMTLTLSDDERYILDYLELYKFNCTVLVNFDIWEQGQVFVNVNFKQKPVNKSLYYDVFGAEYIDSADPKHLERNKIYLAHELTRFMNECPDSPFYRKIKMLGTGKGYVSQSFFVEALLPLFKDTGIWYYDSRSVAETSYILKECESELFNYFLTVSRAFSKYWNNVEKVNLICKTTGIGALTRLMSILHRQLPLSITQNFKYIVPGKEYLDYIYSISPYIEAIVEFQDELFGEKSVYRRAGGKGLEEDLFKKLLSILREKNLLREIESTRNQLISSYLSIIPTNNKKKLNAYGDISLENEILHILTEDVPLEVKALGEQSRVKSLDELKISNINEQDDKVVIVTGTFNCTVDIAESSEAPKYDMTFPSAFTLKWVRVENNKLRIAEDSHIYINTNSFYI